MPYEKTHAELQAEAATALKSFPINLDDVRRVVESLLSRVHSKFFSSYTVHDFGHVHEMLKSLDWIIPPAASKIMSPGDWLLLVLAIYLHDIGLIVTDEEFNDRAKTGFRDFCETRLFSGPEGADYRAKVDAIKGDEHDRFLYQEFVRANHGARSRCWIEGKSDPSIGCTDRSLSEISRLLSPLSPEIRFDLGLICESHNLDDVDNSKKYKLTQPYGNSDNETVNIQYISLILRTSDLLQITSDRAPPVLFRLVNPTDPVSQIEWAKQKAVRRVMSLPGRDKEGVIDESAPRDTVGVFAKFTDENGFFGLTSYLRYAESQLARSYEIAEKSKRDTPKKYPFPWRHIDTSGIEAEGFLTETFGFELDQAKILDLLTGHTLYNDSTVAVRELIQNAIDAVRLQAGIAGQDSTKIGRVDIRWNSEKRELCVSDNGTGMTQEIVQKHLLKVGSSRYQDPKFREQYPNFSPISRFGIGVLSAFMIADSVEIVTCSQDEDQARQISLRSVHGQYLIRLLDKTSDLPAKQLAPNGTSVTLKLRASARRVDVLATVRKWIQFPRCAVNVSIDDDEPIAVGFSSPKAAIESFLETPETARRFSSTKTKVVERKVDGLELAYALKYDSFFRDWSFITVGDREENLRDEIAPIGTAIEGIAVDFSTPGYLSRGLLACANATGPSAPRTNVARSSLEETPEELRATRSIYDVFYDHIREESQRLHKEEGFSLTKSVNEMPYLMSPLENERVARVAKRVISETAFAELPLFLVESREGRKAASLSQLIEAGTFFTTDSQLVRSIETLVKEAQQDLQSGDLLEACGFENSAKSSNNLFVQNIRESGSTYSVLSKHFEPSELTADPKSRRLDAKWTLVGSEPMWGSERSISIRLRRTGNRDYVPYLSEFSERMRMNRRGSPDDVYFAVGEPATTGLDGYQFATLKGAVYLLPGTPISDFISPLLLSDDEGKNLEAIVYLDSIRFVMRGRPSSIEDSLEFAESSLKEQAAKLRANMLTQIPEFLGALQQCGPELACFDPFAWLQRGFEGDL